MATKIRLKRLGGKHDPHFRIVVMDSRTRRDGPAIEELGHYDPTKNPPVVEIDHERAKHWLHVGAQPSDTVRSLLARQGILADLAQARRSASASGAENAPSEPQGENS